MTDNYTVGYFDEPTDIDDYVECNGEYLSSSEVVDRLNELVTKCNTLSEENEQLKSELQKIYDVVTLKKAWNIVNEIYDDLLHETSEESDYARDKLLECLEMLDELGDELE